MLLKILLTLVLLVLVFVVIVLLQPGDFRTTRSAVIAASPADVFAQVNDLHHYQRWNPWGKVDPSMKITFAGPPAGPGASMAWSGNAAVGEGRMTITESRPGERVLARLDFLKPFPGTATAEFTFAPRGRDTEITWTMAGQRAFVPRAIGLFIDMDKMIGSQFEQGLADLRALAEAR